MNSRTVFALSALSLLLAIPAAHAQDSDAATPAVPEPVPAETADAAESAPAPAAQQVSWADLDNDNDGQLSKSEAAEITSLSSVFDRADSNQDGQLTADEYKAWVAANGTPAAKSESPEG